jgi:hypothetical protein
VKLANYFGVSTDYLLRGVDIMSSIDEIANKPDVLSQVLAFYSWYHKSFKELGVSADDIAGMSKEEIVLTLKKLEDLDISSRHFNEQRQTIISAVEQSNWAHTDKSYMQPKNENADGPVLNVPEELRKPITAATEGASDITQEEVDELANYWNNIVKPRRKKKRSGGSTNGDFN